MLIVPFIPTTKYSTNINVYVFDNDNFPRSSCHHASEPLGLEHDPAVLSLSIIKLGFPCGGYCVAIPNDARLSVKR